ncbi:hypothetical protein D3C87_946000 [compost metagenome]
MKKFNYSRYSRNISFNDILQLMYECDNDSIKRKYLTDLCIYQKCQTSIVPIHVISIVTSVHLDVYPHIFWQTLSYQAKIEDIRTYINMPWNLTNMSYHPDLTFDDILLFRNVCKNGSFKMPLLCQNLRYETILDIIVSNKDIEFSEEFCKINLIPYHRGDTLRIVNERGYQSPLFFNRNLSIENIYHILHIGDVTSPISVGNVLSSIHHCTNINNFISIAYESSKGRSLHLAKVISDDDFKRYIGIFDLKCKDIRRLLLFNSNIQVQTLIGNGIFPEHEELGETEFHCRCTYQDVQSNLLMSWNLQLLSNCKWVRYETYNYINNHCPNVIMDWDYSLISRSVPFEELYKPFNHKFSIHDISQRIDCHKYIPHILNPYHRYIPEYHDTSIYGTFHECSLTNIHLKSCFRLTLWYFDTITIGIDKSCIIASPHFPWSISRIIERGDIDIYNIKRILSYYPSTTDVMYKRKFSCYRDFLRCNEFSLKIVDTGSKSTLKYCKDNKLSVVYGHKQGYETIELISKIIQEYYPLHIIFNKNIFTYNIDLQIVSDNKNLTFKIANLLHEGRYKHVFNIYTPLVVQRHIQLSDIDILCKN